MKKFHFNVWSEGKIVIEPPSVHLMKGKNRRIEFMIEKLAQQIIFRSPSA